MGYLFRRPCRCFVQWGCVQCGSSSVSRGRRLQVVVLTRPFVLQSRRPAHNHVATQPGPWWDYRVELSRRRRLLAGRCCARMSLVYAGVCTARTTPAAGPLHASVPPKNRLLFKLWNIYADKATVNIHYKSTIHDFLIHSHCRREFFLSLKNLLMTIT